jgi:imidazolonepropionase-like amidohydrolase
MAFLVTADRLIDGTGGRPAAAAAMVVNGAEIAWVGRRRSLPRQYFSLPAMDFKDATLTPGFIDCHAHFSLFADGRTYEQMAAESDLMMAAVAAKNLAVHLRSGVTTARDNGSRGAVMTTVREACSRGYLSGPRLLVSGPPVTATSGHFHFCGGEADGADGVRRQVRHLAELGVDHVKIMASGGDTLGTNPGKASYSPAELQAAVATAHDLGKLTTAHCRATTSMSRAVTAAIDCVEHGEFLGPDGAARFDHAVARQLVSSDAFLSPVLQANGWDTITRLRADRLARSLTAEEERSLSRLEAATEQHVAHIAELIRTGMAGRVVGGTDAGCYDVSFGHMDYCAELLSAAGMSAADVLRAITSIAAKACGVAALVGTLEVGKRADLVVLGGDPLEDLKAVGDVRAVYHDGALVNRPEETHLGVSCSVF